MPTRPPVFAWNRKPMGIPVIERRRDPFYTTPEWKRLRRQALERDGHQCTRMVNGKRCPNKANTVHHIVERSQGGGDTLENVTSTCQACHNVIHGPEKGGHHLPR